MSNTAPTEIRFQIQPRYDVPVASEAGGITSSVGRMPRITQVLALAIQFEDMIRRGEAKDYADLARLGGLCRERVSQIMRLTCLSPDIQVEVLYQPPTPTGRFPISETAVRKIANLLSWTSQREHWLDLKKRHQLN